MRQAALTGFDLAQGSFQKAYYSESYLIQNNRKYIANIDINLY